MKAQNLNNSSKKTRKTIKRIFAEMLSEKKELGKVSVSELCARAEISRGTFYAHYDDIYAVLNEIENDFIEKLNIYVGESGDNSIDDYPLYLLQKIARFIEADAESSGIFIVDPDFDKFGEKIKNVIKTRIKSAYEISDETENFEFDALLECVSSGFISLCKKSFKGEIKASIDDISKETSRILSNCINH